jgi:hypothetical protein
MADKKLTQKIRYPGVHKLLAGISLVTFIVIVIAGVAAEARFFTITIRAAIALLIISLVGRVVMQVISSYEEMNGGQT